MDRDIAIVLADDHQVVREGLRALLEAERGITIVGEASDGASTLAIVERLEPDVLLLDLLMPGMSGLEVMRQLRARGAKTRVAVVSMHTSTAYVIESLHAGACAYVPKSAAAEELIRGIREAAAGRRYLAKPISEARVADCERATEGDARKNKPALTPREREVVRLTAAGESSTALAHTLHISPRTADKHRANIMQKLGLANRYELVRYALSRELLGDTDRKD